VQARCKRDILAVTCAKVSRGAGGPAWGAACGRTAHTC
jgi:hypothetical protein